MADDMEEEKTLLQQIREKEQEFARKIDAVKQETDRAVEAARNEAEDLLCTADSEAKTEAEHRSRDKRSQRDSNRDDKPRNNQLPAAFTDKRFLKAVGKACKESLQSVADVVRR